MSYSNHLRYSRLAAACALALSSVAVPTLATADDGTVRGELRSASSNTTLEGARVRLMEAGRETYTNASGRFQFQDVTPGEYTLVVDYIGLGETRETVTVEEDGLITAQLELGADNLDAIQVTGQLAGQARAINRQRASTSVKTIVASEEIGEFPDQNPAEALQRLPGLQLQRDQGEGRFVSIRGLNANLNTVSINGMRVPSAENDERQVALDVIPSDLIEGLEVSKTITPDMDGDAIGGNIEVKTLNAFDRDGFGGNARLEGGYNDLRGEWSPRVGGAVSDIFSVGGGKDNLGIAIGTTYEDRQLGSDNMETDGGWILDPATGERFPKQSEQRAYIVDRERAGLAFNVDFRPDDNNEYYLRTLYSDYKDSETRRRNQYTFEDAFDDGFLDTETGIASDGVEHGKDIKFRDETQTIFTAIVGGENRIDDWTIDYELGYASAREEESGRIDAEFVQNQGSEARSYTQGEQFQISGPADMYNSENFALKEVVFEENETEDEEWSMAFNLKKDMEFGDNPGFIKFGAKARMRDKYNDENAWEYTDEFNGDFANVTMDDFATNNVSYPLDNFGPGISSSFKGYANANRGDWAVDEDKRFEDSNAGDFRVSEDVFASYVMGSVDIDRLRVLGGVRVEYTDYSGQGVDYNDDDKTITPVVDDKSYVDVLPGLHLRYELNDTSVLQAAATQTIARPNFGDAAPFVESKPEDGEYEAGNVDLDPYRATNLDLMYSWYPSGSSSAYTAGLFYKDVQDYIVSADLAGTDFNDVASNASEYSTAINGGDATVMGFELSAYQHLDFLPSPFDGMLVTGNYTFTDTEASLDGRDGDIPLPQSSKNTANFALGYEKYGLSLRAAITYRDKFLDEVDDVEDPAFDRYADARHQVDLTAAYDVTQNFQVYAEAINVTDEPSYYYFDQKQYNSQYDEFGPTYKVGVNWRF